MQPSSTGSPRCPSCLGARRLRVADEKRLPFAVQVPNQATVAAMKELKEGEGRRFGSAVELFRDLDI